MTIFPPRRRAALLFLLCLAAPGLAQELQFHSCTGQLGGGLAWASGSDSAGLHSHGWMFEGGGGFATSPKFALIFNFLLEDVGIGAAARPAQTSHGSVKFYSTMFEPTYVAHSFRHVNIYGLGGFGWLRRSVKFTGYQTELTHPGGFSIPGGSNSDSGAFDAGGGINYSPRGGIRIFLEARYLRGLASNSETALIPLTLGIRW